MVYVAVVKTAVVVGHVLAIASLSIKFLFFQFLSRTFNKATCIQWKSGAGYGMEVPACTYHLYGPKAYLERLKKDY